jgi:transcriptional antiterminator NusG
MQWYALFVEANQEENLQKFIRIVYSDDCIRTLVPKRRLIERRQGKNYERILKVFPGYVLVNTDMDNLAMYYRLKESPRVLSVLKTDSFPTPISEDDMDIILALTRYGEIIDFSELYKEGEKIRVKKGPLEGLEGIILKYDNRKKRVKVMIKILDHEKKVDLGVHMITREF